MKYKAALYMRLSKDDGQSESVGISAQRRILKAYSKEHGFEIEDEYIDDGFSGTNFERPAFKRMIKDIEQKRINLVLTKDLSRLGRNYIAAGEYTEIYFPGKGVRYIAVSDGYDSASPNDDIAPFRHVVNEMYARDISRKIRSSLYARMKDGVYIGNFAPYGYEKSPFSVLRQTAVPLEVSRNFSMNQKPSALLSTAVRNSDWISEIIQASKTAAGRHLQSEKSSEMRCISATRCSTRQSSHHSSLKPR